MILSQLDRWLELDIFETAYLVYSIRRVSVKITLQIKKS